MHHKFDLTTSITTKNLKQKPKNLAEENKFLHKKYPKKLKKKGEKPLAEVIKHLCYQ